MCKCRTCLLHVCACVCLHVAHLEQVVHVVVHGVPSCAAVASAGAGTAAVAEAAGAAWGLGQAWAARCVVVERW